MKSVVSERLFDDRVKFRCELLEYKAISSEFSSGFLA